MFLYDSCTVFNFAFNYDSDYVIPRSCDCNTWYGHYQMSFSILHSTYLAISQNMHVCICFLHHFSIRFQPWWWLCNPESMLPQYMIWLSSGSIFWFDFNRDGHYVIWRPFHRIIWYGYHLAPFFDSISTVMVIM